MVLIYSFSDARANQYLQSLMSLLSHFLIQVLTGNSQSQPFAIQFSEASVNHYLSHNVQFSSKLTIISHPYAVQYPNARVYQYLRSLIHASPNVKCKS